MLTFELNVLINNIYSYLYLWHIVHGNKKTCEFVILFLTMPQSNLCTDVI